MATQRAIDEFRPRGYKPAVCVTSDDERVKLNIEKAAKLSVPPAAKQVSPPSFGQSKQPSLPAAIGQSNQPSLPAAIGQSNQPSLPAAIGQSIQPSLPAAIGQSNQTSLPAIGQSGDHPRRDCPPQPSRLMAVFKMIIAFLTFTCFPSGTLHNLKSVVVTVVVKATKLGCVLAHAVTPLLNFWHTLRSWQNESQLASFDWYNILLPTPRSSPQLAPTISPSPSYLHGGFMSLMGVTVELTFVASRMCLVGISIVGGFALGWHGGLGSFGIEFNGV